MDHGALERDGPPFTTVQASHEEPVLHAPLVCGRCPLAVARERGLAQLTSTQCRDLRLLARHAIGDLKRPGAHEQNAPIWKNRRRERMDRGSLRDLANRAVREAGLEDLRAARAE